MKTPASSSTTFSPQAIEKLILHGKTKDLVATLKPLSIKERKKLSGTIYTVYSVAKKKWEYRKIPDKHRYLAEKIHVLNMQAVFKKAQLAVLAVCPYSKTKNVITWVNGGEYQKWMFEILKDRNPSWLKDWIEHRLEHNNTIFLWELVRKLMDQGLLDKPKCDGYVRSMVFYFSMWSQKKKEEPIPSLVERLISIPDTTEDVYRLFEIESSAFQKHYMESWDKKPANFQTWTTAVGILCELGYLDRNRILDASLNGLNLGFSELQLSGFIKVHNHLKPTDSEISKRQSTYMDLLQLRVSRVSDFALKKLSKLERINELDADLFFKHISSVTGLPTKTPIKGALKLAKRVLRKHPEQTAASYLLAYEALQNESSEIQELACDIIEFLHSHLETENLDSFIPLISGCAPKPQERLYSLFALDPVSQENTRTVHEDQLNYILDELALIPDDKKTRWGLNKAHLFASLPQHTEFEALEISVLSTARSISPIQSLEGLIDAISHAIEVVDSADEIERILDGISRFCDQKPDDFEIQTAALLNRIQEPRYSESQRELITGWGRLSLAFQDLLMTWLTGKYWNSPPPFYYTEIPYLIININRIKELTRRVYKQQAGPLFAAPTHEHGWIDPIQLVARLRHLEEDWIHCRRHDLTQALLRITPDRRKEALLLCSNVPHSIRRLLRWALGAEEGPTTKDKKEYELWIAAGRARSPHQSLEAVYQIFNVKDDLPDSALPATYSWVSTLKQSKSNPKYSFPEIQISQNQGMPPFSPTGRGYTSSIKKANKALKNCFMRLVSLHTRPIWKHIPTAALHGHNRDVRHHAFSAWQVHWIQYCWPLQLDSCMVLGIQRMINRINENTASTIPLYCYLEPVFHPYRSWTVMAQLSVWIALISKDAELQNMATEAMIEAITDGRAHPTPLAKVLTQLAEGKWIKLNRLAKALRQVAEISSLHAYVLCTILDSFIAHFNTMPKNVHHILQLMLELHSSLKLSLPKQAAERLKLLSGNSKAAKIANSLQEFTISNNDALTAIFAQSIEGRIEWIKTNLPS